MTPDFIRCHAFRLHLHLIQLNYTDVSFKCFPFWYVTFELHNHKNPRQDVVSKDKTNIIISIRGIDSSVKSDKWYLFSGCHQTMPTSSNLFFTGKLTEWKQQVIVLPMSVLSLCIISWMTYNKMTFFITPTGWLTGPCTFYNMFLWYPNICNVDDLNIISTDGWLHCLLTLLRCLNWPLNNNLFHARRNEMYTIVFSTFLFTFCLFSLIFWQRSWWMQCCSSAMLQVEEIPPAAQDTIQQQESVTQDSLQQVSWLRGLYILHA